MQMRSRAYLLVELSDSLVIQKMNRFVYTCKFRRFFYDVDLAYRWFTTRNSSTNRRLTFVQLIPN